uniref:Uncharacterized protein n=1 Tax=Hyaloperonospora arabidopsidis (strain Emoy2) TaxID=559515 RepID=M4B1G1_HYAAE
MDVDARDSDCLRLFEKETAQLLSINQYDDHSSNTGSKLDPAKATHASRADGQRDQMCRVD